MDLKTQVIQEYLAGSGSYRQLSAKYGISRDVINKWVMIHQGIHNLPPTEKQVKHNTNSMNSSRKILSSDQLYSTDALEQKIALLEKQLQWEKLRADALDIMINVAEKQLDIQIRKKPGSPQSEK